MKERDVIRDLEHNMVTLKQQVDHYRLKYLAVLEYGVRTSVKAINRLKRKNDLKQSYVLASEKLIEALIENTNILEDSQTNNHIKFAWIGLQEKREQLGLVKKSRPENANG